MDLKRLKEQLIKHEDVVPYAYQDSLGYWTIGVGHLIDERHGGKLDEEVIDLQLELDIRRAYAEASVDPWFAKLNDARQNVIVNLEFNMGDEHWDLFVNTKAALARGDIEAAAKGLEASKWYTQVKRRGPELVKQLRTGEFV